jgi:hypothetical protein
MTNNEQSRVTGQHVTDDYNGHHHPSREVFFIHKKSQLSSMSASFDAVIRFSLSANFLRKMPSEKDESVFGFLRIHRTGQIQT